MGFQLEQLLRVKPERLNAVDRCPGTDKTVYYTKADAERAVKLINGRHGRVMKSFRCAWCEHYHLGHRR